MQTFLTLPRGTVDDLPADAGDDDRTPRAYVEHFLGEYTDPGDLVFDPFAGFGTTLAVAESMDRQAAGVEYEPERVAVARERLDDPSLIDRGDARRLTVDDLPAIDCCLTSPPYVVRQDGRDPLENYDGESDYGSYLEELREVFETVGAATAAGGHLLVDVSNMKYDGEVTTLAWDLGGRLAERFDFRGEVVVGWEADGRDGRDGAYGYGYDHSYCLVYRV